MRETARPSAVRSLPMSDAFLAIQHIACEPPAAFEDELRARGLDLVRVELDEGDPLPDWREFAATIVMGGPMGAYEEDAHPWLAEEKRVLGAAARAGHPVWGVCLGAQLLAGGARRGRVSRAPRPRSGCSTSSSRRARPRDPVFGGAPAALPGAAVARRHLRPARRRDAARQLAGLPPTRPSSSSAPTGCSSTSRCRPRWPRVGRGAGLRGRASRRSAGPARWTAWWPS